MIALAAAGLALGAAEEPTPIPQPIAALPLTNGRVLHQVTIVRYADKWVVLKTLGGTGPVNYEMIAEPLRSQLLADRDAKLSASNAPTIVGQPDAAKITGRAYSGDAEHRYVFANMRVDFIPRAYALKKMNPTLGTHEAFDLIVGNAVTDRDGRFRLDVPPGDYVVHATQERRYRNGNRVQYEWVVEVTIKRDPIEITLDDANAKLGFDPPKPKKKE